MSRRRALLALLIFAIYYLLKAYRQRAKELVRKLLASPQPLAAPPAPADTGPQLPPPPPPAPPPQPLLLCVASRSSPVKLQVAINRFKARNLPEEGHSGPLMRLLFPKTA